MRSVICHGFRGIICSKSECERDRETAIRVMNSPKGSRFHRKVSGISLRRSAVLSCGTEVEA